MGRCRRELKKCLDPESNQGHGDFQSPALPAELSRRAARSPFRAAEGGCFTIAGALTQARSDPQILGTAVSTARPSRTATLNSTRLALNLAAISGACLFTVRERDSRVTLETSSLQLRLAAT